MHPERSRRTQGGVGSKFHGKHHAQILQLPKWIIRHAQIKENCQLTGKPFSYGITP
jgi:hypothetical protein